jgi:hypothetical protein
MKFAGTDKTIKVKRETGSNSESVSNETRVEIELIESDPTIQQEQAYRQFWKLFIERVITKWQSNKMQRT